jgi:hypothetical protein
MKSADIEQRCKNKENNIRVARKGKFKPKMPPAPVLEGFFPSFVGAFASVLFSELIV